MEDQEISQTDFQVLQIALMTWCEGTMATHFTFVMGRSLYENIAKIVKLFFIPHLSSVWPLCLGGRVNTHVWIFPRRPSDIRPVFCIFLSLFLLQLIKINNQDRNGSCKVHVWTYC